MLVCMCLCTYECVYVRMNVCMYVSRMYAIHVCMCVCRYTYTHIDPNNGAHTLSKPFLVNPPLVLYIAAEHYSTYIYKYH